MPNIVTAAAFATNLTVTDIFASNNNHGIISFSTNFPNLNACAGGASYQNALAIDLNTPGGRGMLSIALAAKTSNKQVEAQGTDSCTLEPGTMEDAGYIRMLP